MTEQKWLRTSLRHLETDLKSQGFAISHPTLARLLKKNGYSLRVNAKIREDSSDHPERNKQFEYIAEQVSYRESHNLPVISVDSKKKELVGNFKNTGVSWRDEVDEVNVHDFPSDAVGKAVPYGIYDLNKNRGHVYVGQSSDTAEFSTDAISRWWEESGIHEYSGLKELLILGDSGGSNGCRSRLFKKEIQSKLCNRFGLSVTVCHYPRGCSKWNPIEHRLFSYISINWAGKPLRTYDLLLGYLRGTGTKTGLEVEASLLKGTYETGKRVLDEEMKQINLEKHSVCPLWNYTIRPNQYESLNREVKI